MAIEHKGYLDVRDLADQARDAIGEFEAQDFATSGEKEDVVETLRDFYDLAAELRNGASYAYESEFDPESEDFVSDMKAMAQEIEDFQNEHSPTLIHESYFADSVEELVGDVHGVSVSKMPGFLVIDWDATANNLRPNYFEVIIDSRIYLAEK